MPTPPIATYIPKPRVVQAIRWYPPWDEANHTPCQLVTETSKNCFVVRGVDTKPYFLFPGDWIVIDSAGHITGMPDAVFQRTFESCICPAPYKVTYDDMEPEFIEAFSPGAAIEYFLASHGMFGYEPENMSCVVAEEKPQGYRIEPIDVVLGILGNSTYREWRVLDYAHTWKEKKGLAI